MSIRDLIIVGAGPSGLSAAIAAGRLGLDYVVLEQGVLVNSIYRFPPQMVFFTTPELLEIGGLPFVSPYDKPTRAEALRYYRKVTDHYDLKVAFDETVLSVSKEDAPAAMPGPPARQPRWGGVPDGPPRGIGVSSRRGWGPGAREEEDAPAGVPSAPDPVFTLECLAPRGVRRVRHARHVILAIGYYDHPNLLQVPGEDLAHVHHFYGDPHPYYRRRVVVVGGGNSAAEFALELFRAGASVTIVHRGPELKSTIKYWVRPDIENRIKEGSIVARFDTQVVEIRSTSVVVESHDHSEIACDAVFLLTGYRADNQLLRSAGIQLNERDAPTVDPETFETNVPGIFIAGGATAGVDTGTIFIENGRFHGERIVEVIAGRL